MTAKITAGNDLGHFRIGTSSGTVVTNSSSTTGLDMESVTSYTLTVEVYNILAAGNELVGSSGNMANITIDITDVLINRYNAK